VAKMYKKHKGHIDTLDQLVSTYDFAHKTKSIKRKFSFQNLTIKQMPC
jgi:hypothetical protein